MGQIPGASVAEKPAVHWDTAQTSIQGYTKVMTSSGVSSTGPGQGLITTLLRGCSSKEDWLDMEIRTLLMLDKYVQIRKDKFSLLFPLSHLLSLSLSPCLFAHCFSMWLPSLSGGG